MGLTTKYIEEHAANIHTADSFGRGIADYALKAAYEAAKKNGGSISDFKFEPTISVQEFEPLGCIRICVKTPFGIICYHVRV